MVHPEKQAPRKRRKATPHQPSAPQNSPEENAEIDPARREKIEGIRRALEEGTYRVSNEDVASKVIEHMLRPKK